MLQEDVPVDVTTVYRAAVRVARARATSQWPPGWYRTLMKGRPRRRYAASIG